MAILKASLIRRGSSEMSLTMTFHLVHEREMPMTSASWKASDPMADVATGEDSESTTNPGERDRTSELTLSAEDDHGDTIAHGVLHRRDDIRRSRA